jgi:hypothetical protein
MPAFLSLIGGWRTVAIAAAVLVVGIYVGWLKLTIAGLESDVSRLTANLQVAHANVEQAERVNAGNLQELADLRADRAAGDRAVASVQAADEKRCAAAVTIRKEVIRVIEKSPATCPVSESVRAALDGLRTSSGSADRDEDRTRGGAAAGGAAGVPR